MAFRDEIAKLQRTLRVHLRYQTGTGSDNPGVSGTFTDDRWGKVADNTGPIPIAGTVSRFGTFARALSNADQGIEIPSVTTELLDKENEWRRRAAEPWRVINRFFYYTLRVRNDAGAYTDADVAWGQLTAPQFPPGKAQLPIQMVPDYLGKEVPRRIVTKEEWPNADPSALGRSVPIIYGKMDNKAGDITGLTATLIGPSGHVAPVLSGVLATGGSGTFNTNAHYYAMVTLSARGGDATSPLSNVIGPFTNDAINNAVQLSWTIGGTTPGAYRIFRGNSADFGQYNTYRETGYPYAPTDYDGTALSLLDEYPGIDTREQVTPDPHWDLTYRQTVLYYISAIVGGEEQPASGPVGVALYPINRGGQSVDVSWDLVENASSLKLRRQAQNYHFDPGYDREWTLSPSATFQHDPLTDTTPVNVPDGFGRPRAGAVEALYVDTNPAALAGQYIYLIAGHGCKEIREVYVTKSAVTQSGGSSGSVNRPSGLTLTKVGADGTTTYRYTVTAKNANGETTDSSQVRTSTGADTLNGTDYNALTWTASEGATGYNVYRAADDTEPGLLASTSTPSYDDQGGATPDANAHPPENNTTGTAFASSTETAPPLPVLQTKNVDYFVETRSTSGNVYQIIRFNPSQEGNPVTVNVWGIETLATATGNADGGTLIENVVTQFQHFLYNWVFNSYRSGAWFTDTGFKTGLINDASFTAAAASAATRIVGGYKGAGALLEPTDVTQVLQDWLICTDLDWYFWEGQFKVKLFDPSDVDRNALPQYTEQDSIFRETFEPALDMSRHWNRIIWQAGPQVDGYFLSGAAQDATSITNYGRTIESPMRTFFWCRHSATVTDIVLRTLLMTKNPPVYATWSTPLKALNDEIASLIAVTHREGISAVSTGWRKRHCKILRSDIDLDRCVVTLQVLDVDALFSVLGWVFYGDRTWSTADKSFVTAIPSGKTSIYGYYADRTTGAFSNGTAAKKYRSRS